MFKELSQFICIYFFSTDYHLRNGRASPWGLYRGMKTHGPERLSRLSCEQRQPTRGYGGQKTFFFFYLSTWASTSCPTSTSCHCDCSLEWTLECRINDHENGKIVIGLGNDNNNSARASRFLYTSLPSLLKFPIMCCCYLFDFLTLMFAMFIDVWVKLFSALFYTSQRMRTEYNCPVVAGKPKVAFRETIGKEARYELNVATSTTFNITDSFHSIGGKNWALIRDCVTTFWRHCLCIKIWTIFTQSSKVKIWS